MPEPVMRVTQPLVVSHQGDESARGFGDLPLVTISSTDPGDYRLRQQDALAALSTRGTHVIASKSGHWIPLDQPQVVIDAIRDVLILARSDSHSRS